MSVRWKIKAIKMFINMYTRYVTVYTLYTFTRCCCGFFFKFVFRHCAKFNYFLRVAIVATGIWKPRIPDIPGHELMDGYEDLSMNASDYEGKSVMILGNY